MSAADLPSRIKALVAAGVSHKAIAAKLGLDNPAEGGRITVIRWQQGKGPNAWRLPEIEKGIEKIERSLQKGA